MIIYKDIIQWTPEWLEMRWGVITWTKLKNVLAWPKAQDTQIYELVWEEFAPLEEQYTSFAMQRWTDLEPIAKEKYIELTKEKVEEVWFIKSDIYKDEFWEYLWLSPDWIIATWAEISETWELMYPLYGKAIEIKCPWAKNHTKYIIENKTPDEYKDQIINYFLVIDELQELDFISYHPDFYLEDKKLHIINIKRNDLEKDLEKAREKIFYFRKKWIEKIKLLQG